MALLSELSDNPQGPKHRPLHPYVVLIRAAILSSSKGSLTLGQIYDALASRFPYFRDAAPGWKNSVRHNLSLNHCFKRVSRMSDSSGKGSFWTVDLAEEPVTRRIRPKRSNRNKSQRRDHKSNRSVTLPSRQVPFSKHPKQIASKASPSSCSSNPATLMQHRLKHSSPSFDKHASSNDQFSPHLPLTAKDLRSKSEAVSFYEEKAAYPTSHDHQEYLSHRTSSRGSLGGLEALVVASGYMEPSSDINNSRPNDPIASNPSKPPFPTNQQDTSHVPSEVSSCGESESNSGKTWGLATQMNNYAFPLRKTNVSQTVTREGIERSRQVAEVCGQPDSLTHPTMVPASPSHVSTTENDYYRGIQAPLDGSNVDPHFNANRLPNGNPGYMHNAPPLTYAHFLTPQLESSSLSFRPGKEPPGGDLSSGSSSVCSRPTSPRSHMIPLPPWSQMQHMSSFQFGEYPLDYPQYPAYPTSFSYSEYDGTLSSAGFSHGDRVNEKHDDFVRLQRQPYQRISRDKPNIEPRLENPLTSSMMLPRLNSGKISDHHLSTFSGSCSPLPLFTFPADNALGLTDGTEAKLMTKEPEAFPFVARPEYS